MALGPMIVDLTGLTLTDEDCRRLANPMTGGVILFGRNFKNRAQVTKLIRAIRAIRPNIIISVLKPMVLRICHPCARWASCMRKIRCVR